MENEDGYGRYWCRDSCRGASALVGGGFYPVVGKELGLTNY